jgi:TonB family protein
MKRYKINLAVIIRQQTSLLLVGLCLLLATVQATAQEWKEYHSREGKFTIQFPGEPTINASPTGADAPSSVTHTVSVKTPTVTYAVAYFDVPDALLKPQEAKNLLDETRDRMLKQSLLKLGKEQAIRWLDYPGRELQMAGPFGVYLTRIILVKQRVYTLSVVATDFKPIPREAIKYFESFKPTPLTDAEIRQLASAPKAESAKALPSKVKVSGGVLQQSAIKRVQPEYPEAALAAKISGAVQVRILVSEEGQVIEAEVISGPEPLHAAALAAAKQWTFKPIRLEKQPVKAEGVLSFNFTL